jgi:hypothetical protein
MSSTSCIHFAARRRTHPFPEESNSAPNRPDCLLVPLSASPTPSGVQQCHPPAGAKGEPTGPTSGAPSLPVICWRAAAHSAMKASCIPQFYAPHAAYGHMPPAVLPHCLPIKAPAPCSSTSSARCRNSSSCACCRATTSLLSSSPAITAQSCSPTSPRPCAPPHAPGCSPSAWTPALNSAPHCKCSAGQGQNTGLSGCANMQVPYPVRKQGQPPGQAPLTALKATLPCVGRGALVAQVLSQYCN